ncbi:MAG: mevalonate kinase, partial [Pseudomonadota bacterium]
MNKRVTVSAPGSTLVTGEHAVIYGAPAVVAAIEQRATVHLRFTNDQTIRITSQIAPAFKMPLEDVASEGPYRFVLACVLAYKDQLSGGLEIDIRSEINHTLG